MGRVALADADARDAFTIVLAHRHRRIPARFARTYLPHTRWREMVDGVKTTGTVPFSVDDVDMRISFAA